MSKIPSKNKVYWTTKTGQKIDIDEMSLDHLRNALKLIVRNQQDNNKKAKNLRKSYTNIDDIPSYKKLSGVEHEENWIQARDPFRRCPIGWVGAESPLYPEDF